jgi:hypothetical protein
MINLRTLMKKSADADRLRAMVGFSAQRLLGLDVETSDGRGPWRP